MDFLCASGQHADTAAGTAVRWNSGGTETVLVVEDDDAVRAHVTALLDSFGYRLFEASHGTEARDIIRGDAEIDLLLTDIVMPGGIDGFALAETAQALRPGLKVLFTSGYIEPVARRENRIAQDAKVLHKPYRRGQLADEVRAVLDGSGPTA
jgi:CheY-like chemotaxis protein